ncbi:class I SAM-dependent methyltransferase [Candidatus Woesearchaeota archaeon]|nr:class I SAM-dependent methyltransferase [Candidatus Woesearchaeota archaeon]
MREWKELYEEEGIVQKNPSKFVIQAIRFFKGKRVNRILDLGCGTGRHTALLFEAGFIVYACDNSEEAVIIAKKKIKEGKFCCCDMENLPYKNDFFDAVLSHFVIQHGNIGKIEKSISEIHRILRKDGLLFITVPSTGHPEFLTGQEIEKNTKINIDAIDGKMPHHYFTQKEIRELFREFEILKLNHFEGQSERDPTKRLAVWGLYGRKK